MPNVQIFPNIEFLARSAAEIFIQLAEESIADHGVFRVALSGGSTPLSLYALLASEPFSERVDWSRTHFFWGDERVVPPDHPDSNFYRARQALFENVPVPEPNIFRIPAELRPEQAAELYEEVLLRYFSNVEEEEIRERARFDLALLGMGDDGHTASLFPGTPAIHEETRWVAAQWVDKLAAWRITLTPAILNRAAQVLFLVAGEGKSYTLQRVLYGSYQPDRYPAQAIQPEDGEVRWLVDEPAAALF